MGAAFIRMHDAWSRSRDSGLLRLLEQKVDAQVVDLGCGDGRFTLEMQRQIGCARIEGVEIYPPFVAAAIQGGIALTQCDLDAFPFPMTAAKYDVVVANQVIEHLVYPSRFLKEIYRLLKPGGYAIISTENLSSWDNVLALTLGFTPFSMQFDDGYWKVGNPLTPHAARIENSYAPHTRIFTLRGLRDLTNLLGFHVEVAIGTGHVLGLLGQSLDESHCRFITIKCRKVA
ncbi:MAG: class I SAM-dependent methyltransferase [Lentisphaerae bacterium]|nr:class I SAM-dependent methyltransferase [Lentisphaerota bacterium]